MSGLNNELFLCQCNSAEHQIIISYWPDSKDGDVYVTIHLNKLPLLKRLIYGIKYIFGYQSKYGAFDEVILKPEDSEKLSNVVKYLTALNRKNP